MHKQNYHDITYRYDMMDDLRHYKSPKSTHDTGNSSHLEIAQQLNRQQKTILKSVLISKKLEPHKTLYLFLTGGASTWKTFIVKVLFEVVICILIRN